MVREEVSTSALRRSCARPLIGGPPDGGTSDHVRCGPGPGQSSEVAAVPSPPPAATPRTPRPPPGGQPAWVVPGLLAVAEVVAATVRCARDPARSGADVRLIPPSLPPSRASLQVAPSASRSVADTR